MAEAAKKIFFDLFIASMDGLVDQMNNSESYQMFKQNYQ